MYRSQRAVRALLVRVGCRGVLLTLDSADLNDALGTRCHIPEGGASEGRAARDGGNPNRVRGHPPKVLRATAESLPGLSHAVSHD